MARSFKAQFKGKCQKCNGTIAAGEEVTWSRNPAKKGVVHKQCFTEAGDTLVAVAGDASEAGEQGGSDAAVAAAALEAAKKQLQEQLDAAVAGADAESEGEGDQNEDESGEGDQNQDQSEGGGGGGGDSSESDDQQQNDSQNPEEDYWEEQKPQEGQQPQEQQQEPQDEAYWRMVHERTKPYDGAVYADKNATKKAFKKAKKTAELAVANANAAKTLAKESNKLAKTAATKEEVARFGKQLVDLVTIAAKGQGTDEATVRRIAEAVAAAKMTSVERVVVIKREEPTGEQKVVDTSMEHKLFPKLVYLLNRKHHVYLAGPPGSGKSTAADHAAAKMGLAYGYISLTSQTQDSRVIGFLSPDGQFRDTEFFRRYTEGGIFCIDEVDNASGNMLTALNSSIENKIAAFPDGLHNMHPDFRLVTTGNTMGRGGNPLHPERRPLDVAFLDRFTFLVWDYDEVLEMAIAKSKAPGDKTEQWVKWVQAARAYCKVNLKQVVITPRASFKGAEYIADGILTLDEIAEGVVWRGLDRDTVNRIVANAPMPKLGK